MDIRFFAVKKGVTPDMYDEHWLPVEIEFDHIAGGVDNADEYQHYFIGILEDFDGENGYCYFNLYQKALEGLIPTMDDNPLKRELQRILKEFDFKKYNLYYSETD